MHNAPVATQLHITPDRKHEKNDAGNAHRKPKQTFT